MNLNLKKRKTNNLKLIIIKIKVIKKIIMQIIIKMKNNN